MVPCFCGSSDTTHSMTALPAITPRTFVGCDLADLYGWKVSVKTHASRGRGRRRGAIRARLMPIRAFLDAHSFDGETVRLMGIAFETALGSLRATPDPADPVREAVARKIIELAKAGERDPERLCDGALKDLRLAVSAPSPLQLLASSPVPPDSILSQSG